MKKFFKKTLSIIGVVFLCLMIIGQITKPFVKSNVEKDKQRLEFNRMVERADRDCPIPAVMGKGAVTGIKLENGFVTYYLSYDKDFLNLLSRLNDDEKAKEGIMMCFLCVNAQGSNQGDLLMDLLIKFDYGLRVVITESAVGRFECSATADEIKSLRERYKLNPHEALYNLLLISIEAERASLPIKLDEGMFMTDYKLEDEDIAITILMDENIYSIEEMYDNKELIKASMIEEGLSDPESKALFDMCKVSHTGLVYRICGNLSSKHFDIRITSNEIRRFVPTPSNVNIR